jgi:membrane protease YdiL (CAAX protease family)
MSGPSPDSGKAVLGWLLFAALCVLLETTGMVEGLTLPLPLTIALVLARALETHLAAIADVLRGLAVGVAALCVVAAALVPRWGIGLLEFSPSALAVVLVGLGALITIAAWRRARALLLAPFGLNPDCAVHVVSGLGFLLALLATAVSFIELQGQPPEPVRLGVGDSLVALLGDGALALAGVGFLHTRGLSATLERLDVRPLRPRAVLAVVAIAAAFHAAVWALERMESVFLPGLAALEDRFDYEFVGLPPVLGGVLLSIGVGLGEELLFRGAMQPRFGIVPTAVLFAAFHIQYQIPGIVMIFLVGVGIGLIKNRTSTTFTAAVHVLYDIGAFLLPDV